MSDKKPWYKSLRRGPLVVAWFELVCVWALAFMASRVPGPQRSSHAGLNMVADIVALVSFVQFFTGVLYLFAYPHTPLRKRLLICVALFFSLAVIIATKQGVVTPAS